MIVLLDLDGTLVHTAESSFKPMKDGLIDTKISSIPIFNGAKEFIANLQRSGHVPLIISDSHPKYVNPIAQQLFGLPALSLADKPNTLKTSQYLQGLGHDVENKDNFIVVGDTWLDIETGRGLNFKTILTQFYKATEVEERDGIGKTWNQLKSGPTYVAENYNAVFKIINNPEQYLWGAESVFQGATSVQAFKLYYTNSRSGLTIFRSLGRQEDGECDRFGIATQYKEFHRQDRSAQNLQRLATSVQTYLNHLVVAAPEYRWDYFSYVSDKASTTPPNKLKELFNLIQSPIMKIESLIWADTVNGSIRNRVNYRDRKEFINENLKVLSNINLTGKSIVVLDDQFTTGGTAHAVVNMLRQKGAKNILFVTLWFMISLVASNRVCPKCGKRMQIKIRKSDGNKFYSCTPPQYRGSGCGYAENY